MSLKKIIHKIDELLSVVENRPRGDRIRNIFNPDIKHLLKSYSKVNQILNNAPNIWLASDWHLWKKGLRNNPDKDSLISNQIKTVGSSDAFIYLGDIAHRDSYYPNLKDEISKIFKSLKGKKILILGNHDIFEDAYYQNECGFEHVNDGFYWDRYVFSHAPLHFSLYNGAKYNVHGHTHGYNCDRRVPYKNHVCIYSKAYGNYPIKLEDAIRRFERYKR
jgi:calcineurin-like phosphoesterase family protein